MKRFKKVLKKVLKYDERANSLVQEILTTEKFVPIRETKKQDVFIAGFPKSGNTWMQNLIAGVLFGINTEYLPDRLTQELVPDIHYKKYYKRYLNSMCFKTHNLPQKKYKKVIYLVRDPRDVMVSFYHFKKNLGLQVDIERMIRESSGDLNNWKIHVMEWQKNPFKAEKIIIRYEDLVINPIGELKRITEFLNISRDSEELLRSINGNSFENMRKKENVLGLDNELNKVIQESGSSFFRKGKVGNYKEELSIDLIKTIESKVHNELGYYGYLQ